MEIYASILHAPLNFWKNLFPRPSRLPPSSLDVVNLPPELSDHLRKDIGLDAPSQRPALPSETLVSVSFQIPPR